MLFRSLHGSAHWAEKKEIKAMEYLDGRCVYVGGWWDVSSRRQLYLRHNGPEHVLCFAPTRSGKGDPFPRSERNLKSLATLRGATAGCEYAESFVLLKEIQ